jgi:hypothetical protein
LLLLLLLLLLFRPGRAKNDEFALADVITIAGEDGLDDADEDEDDEDNAAGVVELEDEEDCDDEEVVAGTNVTIVDAGLRSITVTVGITEGTGDDIIPLLGVEGLFDDSELEVTSSLEDNGGAASAWPETRWREVEVRANGLCLDRERGLAGLLIDEEEEDCDDDSS